MLMTGRNFELNALEEMVDAISLEMDFLDPEVFEDAQRIASYVKCLENWIELLETTEIAS